MENLENINTDSLDILNSNSFIHNEYIFIPSLKEYIKGKTLSVNNVKSIAKMFMLESEKLENTLLHYLTNGKVSLNYLTHLDKLSILSQVVIKNSFDTLEVGKDCVHCDTEIKTELHEDNLDFESWKSPCEIIKSTKGDQTFEFELGLPSITDLSNYKNISIHENPLAFVKSISINDNKINNLDSSTKSEIFKYISHDMLDYKVLEKVSNINIEIKIPHRCHNCMEINYFHITQNFIWDEIITKFFIGSFKQVIEDEIFITRNSSTPLNSLGNLSFMDFGLYVNKLEHSIIKEAEYKRDQEGHGNQIIS